MGGAGWRGCKGGAVAVVALAVLVLASELASFVTVGGGGDMVDCVVEGTGGGEEARLGSDRVGFGLLPSLMPRVASCVVGAVRVAG